MTLDQAAGVAQPELPPLPKANRHNLDFEFQAMPQGWRGDDATDLDHQRFAALRFATVVDLLDFETGDLPTRTRHSMKARVSNFGVFLSNTKNAIRHEMLPAAKHLFNHWVENLSAMAWNVLDSFFKAKDQRVFLHMVNLYNNGAIMLPGCDKPLNECTFDEVIAADKDNERQYWQEQQRQGKFIALTYGDLVQNVGHKPLEEITLNDFVLARAAIQKADLIAYEAPDGRRLVLKDINEPTEPQAEHAQAA